MSPNSRFTKFLIVLWVVAFAGLRRAATQDISTHFNQVSDEVIESRLRRFSDRNQGREESLRAIFEEAGCRGQRLTEQAVRREALPNLICRLPGATDSTIIVGAHFDHVRKGKGVIDNWSGASLLPSLFESLSVEPRKHTFLFIGFTGEEDGLVGSWFYVSRLTDEQVARTRAMINLDSLGLGPPKIGLNHSDRRLARLLTAVAETMSISVQIVDAAGVGDDDTHSFISRRIPTLMLHSITQRTVSVLHSPDDDMPVVRLKDYSDTYHLATTFLAYLDKTNE